MKLVEMKCKNCGAKLEVDSEAKEAHCEFCGIDFKIDDEVQHVKYDDMEQSGYEFEKGRIRAQQENESNQPTKVVYVNNNNQSKRHGCAFYFLCLLFLPFVITYYVLKSENISRKGKIIILSILWGIILIFMIVDEVGKYNVNQQPWKTDCTQISDFEYVLDTEEVIISEYKGSDKRVKVCDKYTIDGKEYKVTKFSDDVFEYKRVMSVILPEGLTSIPSYTFMGTDLKYLYIPSTVQPLAEGTPFYKELKDVEIVKYGGSEEQWSALTNNEARENISIKKIEYNSKIEDLK